MQTFKFWMVTKFTRGNFVVSSRSLIVRIESEIEIMSRLWLHQHCTIRKFKHLDTLSTFPSVKKLADLPKADGFSLALFPPPFQNEPSRYKWGSWLGYKALLHSMSHFIIYLRQGAVRTGWLMSSFWIGFFFCTPKNRVKAC